MVEAKWKAMAERTTILRCLVGSQAYGLSLDGNSDRDERGICVEDFEAANNLTGLFDEYEFRTATERTGDKWAKSEAGDLDLKIYSLRKFLNLALQGNPNSIELLFLPSGLKTKVGNELQNLYPEILSKAVAGRYLGYINGQKARYLGVREGGRADLVEKYGYDVKCASHVLRLGLQAIEVLTTGKLTFPMTGDGQAYCLNVKMGKHTIAEVNEASAEIEAKILKLKDTSPLPNHPNRELVEDWMQDVYARVWERRRAQLRMLHQENEYVH